MDRQCTKCKQWKSLSEFYKDKTQKGGYHCWCKECKRESTRQYQQAHYTETQARIKVWRLQNQEKVKGYARRSYLKNRERTKERRRQQARMYYYRHREKNKERMKRYRVENKERLAAALKKWCFENPEKRHASSVRYRESHREEIKERSRRWRQRFPERRRRAEQRARAIRQNADGHYSVEQWQAILSHYAPDGACLCCGQKASMTIDHVVPLARGGTNYPRNLQPLCKNCNSRKHAKPIDYRPDNGAFALSLEDECSTSN